MTAPERACAIARTLGHYRAARYLRSRGWSFEAAHHILVTSRPPPKQKVKK